MLLEDRRALQEDLEVIEKAISERFQRNPSLYYHNLPILSQLCEANDNHYDNRHVSKNMIYKVRKIKRSKKQLMAQEHEIKLFLKDRSNIIDKLEELNTIPVPSTDLSITDFKQSLEPNNDKDGRGVSTKSLRDKLTRYAMFPDSSANNYKQLLAQRSENLDINTIFTREEQYGEYFDLDSLYCEWINVLKSSECTIIDFLTTLENIFIDKLNSTDINHLYLVKPPMDRKNGRYVHFVEKFAKYLENYLYKSYPLVDKALIESNLTGEFLDEYINKPIKHDISSSKLFCVACGKNFANASVFENHIDGKNHKKNFDKRKEFYLAEFKTKKLLNILREVFHNTKSFTERKLAFSVDERREELERITKIYTAPVYGANEEEKDLSEMEEGSSKESSTNNSLLDGSFDMPLGPDGMPMPFWLYKLQGLDVQYTCEICSNKQFQGRRAYEKHFREPTHEYHLKCLGITPSSVFKGITTIKEAQSLWQKINSSTKAIKIDHNQHDNKDPNKKHNVVNTIKMDIEVEDDDGNVMTEQVYNDLKKQGLL